MEGKNLKENQVLLAIGNTIRNSCILYYKEHYTVRFIRKSSY